MSRQLDRRAGPHLTTGWMTLPQQPGASSRRARSLPGRAARAGPLLAGLRALPSVLTSTTPGSGFSTAPCTIPIHSFLPQQAGVIVKS